MQHLPQIKARVDQTTTASEGQGERCALNHISSIQSIVQQHMLEWQMVSEDFAQGSLPQVMLSNIKALQSPLHMAIAADRPSLVRKLIEGGADPHQTNSSGQSPLHYATLMHSWSCIWPMLNHGLRDADGQQIGYAVLNLLIAKQFELTQKLIGEAKADLTCTIPSDNNGALHLACQYDAPQILIEKFVMQGANVNLQNIQGDTPLHIAVKQDKENIVALLMTAGADSNLRNSNNHTPVRSAGKLGHYKCLKVLATLSDIIKGSEIEFGSALLSAVSAQQFELATYLIEQQPQIFIGCHYATSNGNALHYAILHGAPLKLISLLAKQVNLNEKYKLNDERLTPLHLAVKQDYPQAIPLLLKAGADVTIVNHKNYTPVELASNLIRLDCLNSLIKFAAYDSQDRANFGSALLTLMERCLFEIAAYLLKMHPSANLNWSFNSTGYNCLHLAIKNNAPWELTSSIADESELDTQCIAGNTALHLAIKLNQHKAVALLAALGASIHVENKQKETPLGLVCNDKKLKCLDALLNYTPKEVHQDFGRALCATLEYAQFQSARKILNSNFEGSNKWSSKGLGRKLQIAIQNEAPLDIIDALLRKPGWENLKELKKNMSSTTVSKHTYRLISYPESFNIDVLAIQEFFQLHQLGHWHISKLSKELLILIAKQFGHDDYFANQLLINAEQLAKVTRESFFSLQNQPRLFQKKFHFILNQYGNVPIAVETALKILASMKELESTSFLETFFSTAESRCQNRQRHLIELSELVIAHNSSSTLAFYFRGIYGPNGKSFLQKASDLIAHNGTSGLNAAEIQDLKARLSRI